MENNILNFVSIYDTLAIQKISNHPTISDCERYVALYGVNITAGHIKNMSMSYEIIHIVNGQKVNVHPIGKPDWIINNKESVFIRNEQGNAILNPNYEPVYSEEIRDENDVIIQEAGELLNANDQYLSEKAFTYFKQFWDNATAMSKRDQFEFYIQMLDLEDQFFNFY